MEKEYFTKLNNIAAALLIFPKHLRFYEKSVENLLSDRTTRLQNGECVDDEYYSHALMYKRDVIIDDAEIALDAISSMRMLLDQIEKDVTSLLYYPDLRDRLGDYDA